MPKMTVILHRMDERHWETVGCVDVDDASAKVVEWQNSCGLGRSECGPRHGDVRQGDKLIGRVGYGGKFRTIEELTKEDIVARAMMIVVNPQTEKEREISRGFLRSYAKSRKG